MIAIIMGAFDKNLNQNYISKTTKNLIVLVNDYHAIVWPINPTIYLIDIEIVYEI